MVLTRQKQVILRLKLEEAHKLQTLAADSGVSISAWLRNSINQQYEVFYGSEEKVSKKTRKAR
jgi:hypothetical protein